jgi:lipid II:glycine glycyltransferase (peptidoglycan interpeptide bridge formation enzyme)
MQSIDAREEYHFDREYFNGIAKLGSNNWMVYLAYTPNSKIMGGCLLLFSERFCHYHLSGSLKEYIKYKPNDMLRHTVIKDMLESNIEKIHFGGGLTRDTNDGLFSFKLKFSKQVCQFKVGYCVVDEKKYKSLCEQWDAKYPEKQEFANFFLKYRY